MLPCPCLPACQFSTFTACLQSRISVLQEVIVHLLLTFFFLFWPSYCAFGLLRLWNKYILFTCLHVHTAHLNYFMPFKKNLFYSLFFCINIKSAVFNFLWLTETKIDYPFESVQLGYMMKNGTPAKILT